MYILFPPFLAFLAMASAHTRFTTLHINWVSQGDGKCIRQDQDIGTTTNYVDSITSPDMACGKDGEIPAPDTCSLYAGDTISLEHRMWPDASQPGAIDVSHKGNTAIYMKKITSMNDAAQGGGWFKIYWDGYNSSTNLWGTDNMNIAQGMVSTTIPEDLGSGLYLVRSEVLALQEVGNPQMYVGCAQIKLDGTGTAVPSDTATIPGYIDMSTAAMTVNIYETFVFTEYGPKGFGSNVSGLVQSISSNGQTSSTVKPGQQTPAITDGGSSRGKEKGQQQSEPADDNVSSTGNTQNQGWRPANKGNDNGQNNNRGNISEDDCSQVNQRKVASTTLADSSWGRWNNVNTRSNHTNGRVRALA